MSKLGTSITLQDAAAAIGKLSAVSIAFQYKTIDHMQE
jgi:hypothetical protein